jgi:hypothetical protein
MRKLLLATIAASFSTCGAFGQTSLFNRFDVMMTGWAQLPPGMPWGGETSWVAADGQRTGCRDDA